ncbi:MAG: hypothetical protein J5755_04665, partial [Clostridia bacterium]|nr:hypothetical protein [Clostridia bacterium]
MKKALLVLILTLAVATVFFATTLCYAQASGDEDAPTATYVTQDYVELGEVLALAASDQAVAAVEVKDDVTSIVLLGDTIRRVALPQGLTPEAASIRLALGEEALLADLGDDALYAYDLQSGAWAKTALVTSLKQGYFTLVLSAFAVDPASDILYMGYGSNLMWIDLEDALGESVEYDENKIHSFDQSTHSYNLFYVLDNVCYLFNTNQGSGFEYMPNLNAIGQVRSVEAFDDFAPAGWYLRDGVVWRGDRRVLDKANEEQYLDGYLRQAAAIAATSNRLLVADNGQGAIKQYDLEGKLTRMWGTWGESQDRLHDPAKLSTDSLVVVNDRGNSRVVIYDPAEDAFTEQPLSLPADCVATYGSLVYVGYGQFVDIFDLTKRGTTGWRRRVDLADGNAEALAADATGGYAVKEGRLLSLASDVPTEWVGVTGAYQVKVGKHAGIVYVLGRDGHLTCFKDGLKVEGVDLSLAGLGVIDWTTDLYGNVYALSSTSLSVYTRLAQGFGEPTVLPLAGYQSLEITPQGEVYALSGHALVRLDLAVPTEESASTPPQADTNAGVRAICLSVNEVWGYTSPDNFESIVCVTHPYAMLVATVDTEDGKFWYAECTVKGEEERYPYVYVPYDKASLVPDKAVDISIKYNGLSEHTGVYAFPSNQAAAIATVARADAIFHAKRIVAVEDADPVWAWYEVD